MVSNARWRTIPVNPNSRKIGCTSIRARKPAETANGAKTMNAMTKRNRRIEKGPMAPSTESVTT
jgi:hypothetical protein